jgi:hypothetical protein
MAAANLVNADYITHIKAHPERNKGSNWTTWTTKERGIYLADLLAGGKTEEFWIMSQGEVIEIPELTITEYMVQVAGHSMYRNEVPYLGSVPALQDKRKVLEYLKNRDSQSRHTIDRPEHWVGSTYELAASLAKSGSTGIMQLAARFRLIWDKLLSGANQAHYGMTQDENKIYCRFCAGRILDTVSHQIATCRQTQVVIKRNEALQNFDEAIETAQSSKTNKRVADALRMYKEILLRSNDGHAWLGLWFAQQADEICRAMQQFTLTVHQYNMVHKTLRKLMTDSIKITVAHQCAVADMEERDELTRMQEPNANRVNVPSVKEQMMILNRRKRVRKHKARELLGEDMLVNIKKKRCEEETAKDPNANEVYKGIIANDIMEGGIDDPLLEQNWFPIFRRDWKKKKKD